MAEDTLNEEKLLAHWPPARFTRHPGRGLSSSVSLSVPGNFVPNSENVQASAWP